jgi:HK97 family phage portal protein
VGLVSEFSSGIFRINASGPVTSPISPHDDYWFTRPGYTSDSGMQVSPESAMQLAAVYACIRVISETLASLPFIIYKRLPDGGKERAVDHPLYQPLHDKPNIYQTSMEFFEMMQAHLELRGNAFALIIPGPRGAVDQLIPLHPDRVDVYRLPNGKLRYQVREWYTGAVKNYAMEEIYHQRGLSADGMVGLSTIAVQREVIGTGLAQQQYAGRFFANDSQPRGILKHPGKLGDPIAQKRLKESWQESQSGANRHRVAVLEEGMEYQALSLNNVDSQFIQARQYSRSDIAGFFRVPLHKIGDLSKSAFSNIEQQAIEFVTDCIRPRAVRWERRIANDLIEPLELNDGQEYFGEFLLDGLLRGDIKSRYEAYGIARTNGWFSVNDIRRKENENPIKGGDEYLRPLNMVPVGTPGPDPTEEAALVTDDSGDLQDNTNPKDPNAKKHQVVKAQLRDFAFSAAERVVRKEVTALRKMLIRANGDIEKFDREAEDFYSTHAVLVAETMTSVPITKAEEYIRQNLKTLKAAGPEERGTVIALFEDLCPQQLADLAIGGK